MNRSPLLALVGAGATFTAAVIAGILAGIAISARTGQQLWVLGGLFAGLALGGYAAFRLIARAF